MLKADLHVHSTDCPVHKYEAKHSSIEAIDEAARQGFDAIAFTHINTTANTKEVIEHAKRKGILLIPATEMKVEAREVLLYNITNEDIKKIKTFDDLRVLKKKKNIMVIAPHPFFILKQCVGRVLEKNIDVFDGIEWSFFYTRFFNRNKKALKVAKRHNKAMVGNSDAHALWQMGTTYSLIHSEKSIDSLIDAVKKGNVNVITSPLTALQFLRVFCHSARHIIKTALSREFRRNMRY